MSKKNGSAGSPCMSTSISEDTKQLRNLIENDTEDRCRVSEALQICCVALPSSNELQGPSHNNKFDPAHPNTKNANRNESSRKLHSMSAARLPVQSPKIQEPQQHSVARQKRTTSRSKRHQRRNKGKKRSKSRTNRGTSRNRVSSASRVRQAKMIVTRETKDIIVETDDESIADSEEIRLRTGKICVKKNLAKETATSVTEKSQYRPASESVDSEGIRVTNKKKALEKLFTSHPESVRAASTSIESFLKSSRKVRLHRSPSYHLAMEVCCLSIFEIYLKLRKKSLTYEHIRDNMENLFAFVEYLDSESPVAAKYLAEQLKKIMFIICDTSVKLEHYSGLKATNWIAVATSMQPFICKNITDSPTAEMIPHIGDFHEERILGAGGFGAAYKASYGVRKQSSIHCTLKLVPRSMFDSAKHACVDKVVGSCTRHSFIVSYFSTFLTDAAFVTVMEYVRGVDLSRVIKTQGGLFENQIQVIMAQLGIAVQYMHLRGFIHRDIKPSNMMVLPGCYVKLIDFDTIKISIGCYTWRKLSTFKARAHCEFNDRESAGTLPYFPPEIVKVRYYGRAIDWWAVGVTAYQCFFGKLPFRGSADDDDLKGMIRACRYSFQSRSGLEPSSPLKTLITQLMTKKASLRLCSKDFNDYIDHCFFSGLNWDKVGTKALYVSCEGIEELCERVDDTHYSPKPSKKSFGDDYLKLRDQKPEINQIHLYTYLSPGFNSVFNKMRKREPFSETDLFQCPEKLPSKNAAGKYQFVEFLYEPKNKRRKDKKSRTKRRSHN